MRCDKGRSDLLSPQDCSCKLFRCRLLREEKVCGTVCQILHRLRSVSLPQDKVCEHGMNRTTQSVKLCHRRREEWLFHLYRSMMRRTGGEHSVDLRTVSRSQEHARNNDGNGELRQGYG